MFFLERIEISYKMLLFIFMNQLAETEQEVFSIEWVLETGDQHYSQRTLTYHMLEAVR